MPANYKTEFIAVSNGANLWYELADDSPANQGLSAHHDEQGNPIFVANYHTSSNPNRAKYDSKRIEGDNGGADGETWYTYAVKNQSGYRCRVLYKEYYHYTNGFYPNHLLGTNQHGQDIFACLGYAARLSFLLAISVSVLNFIIGIVYGAIEGYYGGAVDLILERISDVLASVPFLVVVTLFLATLTLGTLAVTLIEDGRFTLADLLFECASAMGTVGVSAVGTPNLTAASRAVLIPMMFLGRVGPLTLAVAVARRQGRYRGPSKYPEEKIMIG